MNSSEYLQGKDLRAAILSSLAGDRKLNDTGLLTIIQRNTGKLVQNKDLQKQLKKLEDRGRILRKPNRLTPKDSK